MAVKGPFIILTDDPEDRELIQAALQELKVENPVRFFCCGQDALYHLMDTREQPGLILADINLPGMDGLELRRKINESHYLHRKSIPFIFFTNSVFQEDVIRAFDLMAQGYFVKPDSFEGLKELLRRILEYWTHSLHPNNSEKYKILGGLS
jgi:CheY-like chemotaxis protein